MHAAIEISSHSPSMIAATAAPAGNVTITWSGPAEAGAGVVQMALYSCLTTAGCGNTANWSNTGIAISGNPQTVTHNCGQGVSCTYRVVAIGSGGAGSSASSATSVAAGSTLPGAPSGLTAASHPTTIGAVNLGWVAPANAGSFPVTDYVFQRSINGGAFSSPISCALRRPVARFHDRFSFESMSRICSGRTCKTGGLIRRATGPVT